MKVSRKQSLTRSFVLDNAELERLGERLEVETPRLSLEASCRDGLKREFSSMPELLSFENPPKKDIKTLRISGYSEDFATRVWLHYDRGLTANVYFSLEGEENPVLQLNDSIEEHLARVKPWYSVLSRLDFILVLCFSWLCLVLIFSVIPAIVNGRFRNWLSQGIPRNFWDVMIPILLGLAVAAIGLIINLLKTTVFPMGVFAIGQGAKRHRDKEILRTVVIIGSLVSLLSSIVVAIIFSK